jgi:hypothetical protein
MRLVPANVWIMYGFKRSSTGNGGSFHYYIIGIAGIPIFQLLCELSSDFEPTV